MRRARRQANVANRELRRDQARARMVASGVLVTESGGTPMPAVEVFDCTCGRRTGMGSIQFSMGYCGGCHGPFVLGPCAECGVDQRQHRDGWNGNWLSCEEARKR